MSKNWCNWKWTQQSHCAYGCGWYFFQLTWRSLFSSWCISYTILTWICCVCCLWFFSHQHLVVFLEMCSIDSTILWLLTFYFFIHYDWAYLTQYHVWLQQFLLKLDRTYWYVLIKHIVFQFYFRGTRMPLKVNRQKRFFLGVCGHIAVVFNSTNAFNHWID